MASHHIKSHVYQIPLPRKIHLTTPCAWLPLTNPNPNPQLLDDPHSKHTYSLQFSWEPVCFLVIWLSLCAIAAHRYPTRTTRLMGQRGVTSQNGSTLEDIHAGGHWGLHNTIPYLDFPLPCKWRSGMKPPCTLSPLPKIRLNNPMHTNMHRYKCGWMLFDHEYVHAYWFSGGWKLLVELGIGSHTPHHWVDNFKLEGRR